MVKGALWSTFRWNWIKAAIYSCIAECTGVFQCYLITFLVNYIRDEDAPYTEGIKLVVIFGLLSGTSQMTRGFYIHTGYMTSICMRRTLVAILYDKVTKLSMKSLIATNSGKLISVISGDLFAAERSLTFVSLVISCPIVNIVTYVIIGLQSSWVNSAIVFGVWIVMICI